jgi:N-methylhydantoinase B/oxoprolinase/acetone carboxylase alpha subunit
MSRVDPVELEIFKSLFVSIAEEMGVTLCRSSFSPNIKERKDYSCAVFDGNGRTVAQGDHLPVHLGAMPLSVQSAIERIDLEPGDAVVLNDPFRGGTHLPDITLVSPVFVKGRGRPACLVANRAHHSDVGGTAPGSMALATEIFQEGIIIPPVKLVRRGRIDRDVLSLVLANVRTPEEREGDLTAQLAANRIGERRLVEIIRKYGFPRVSAYMRHLQDYSERIMRRAIRDIPDGDYSFEDRLDDDGVGPKAIRIRVTIRVRGSLAEVDFRGSDGQVKGSVNANFAITLSATMYAFRSIIRGDVPCNSGLLRPIRLLAPEGSVVNARSPAAVAGGNVETSQRITDVLLGALARAIPDRIPAASSGTMNNITFGGTHPATGRSFAYYETIGGGMGASPERAGLSGVHTHMTNTRNTPVEALEHYLPVRIRRYSLRRGSGGKGRFDGGDGIVREYEFLAPAQVNILSERRRFGPYGLAGGAEGKKGKNTLVRKGRKVELRGKVSFRVKAGDGIIVETPGGGGYGKVKARGSRLQTTLLLSRRAKSSSISGSALSSHGGDPCPPAFVRNADVSQAPPDWSGGEGEVNGLNSKS